MPETSIVKRIQKWKPFTGRPAGRPKSRWEDDVRNDLKKMSLRSGRSKSRIALSGRILLRRPRLYQSCSAMEKEEKKKRRRRRRRKRSRKGCSSSLGFRRNDKNSSP